MKKYIFKPIAILIWLVLMAPLMAGPADPPGEDDPIDPTPIDNWMLLLIVAGIALGAYYLIKQNKKAVA